MLGSLAKHSPQLRVCYSKSRSEERCIDRQGSFPRAGVAEMQLLAAGTYLEKI